MLPRDLLILSLAAVLVPASVVFSALPPTVLPLERAFPPNQEVPLELLRARDRSRHSRILQSTVVGGIVDFSVEGTSDPYVVGLYYTKVKLGSPPREFSVQIDTGSDILWITCSSCSNCPQSSGLGVQLNFFDVPSSSSAFVVPCSDPMCSSSLNAATQCSSQSNQCSYAFQYGDGSGTSGYYVYDALSFDMILGESMIVNSSAAVVFGCSTYQSGDLAKIDKAVDGIFGFGRGRLSVISQLASRGIAPKIFSHCLRGTDNGGGILVLGEILEPSIVYSPLVPSQPHYSIDLQSIAVNGQILAINPTVFATSGTIVDSGTTLAYLVEEAYDPLVNAITAAVSQYVTPTVSKGTQCYLVPNSISEIFPPLSFNFAGGASMFLKPEEYLIRIGFDNAAVWCIGFQKVQQGVSILGDLFLKDKIFVYDISRQRIGWANYDCSLSVNVSVTSGKEFINEGQLRENSSSRNEVLVHIITMTTVALLIQILVLSSMDVPFFAS